MKTNREKGRPQGQGIRNGPKKSDKPQTQLKGKPRAKNGKPNQKSRGPPRKQAESVSVNFVVNPRHLKHQLVEVEKQKKRDAFKQQKEEKAKKFNEYQKRKLERSKILGQKTRKGQPVMKGRMEMLLNQIQYKLAQE